MRNETVVSSFSSNKLMITQTIFKAFNVFIFGLIVNLLWLKLHHLEFHGKFSFRGNGRSAETLTTNTV